MLGLIAYDTDLKRPACVLVAAGMGGDPKISQRFKNELWLFAPTPGTFGAAGRGRGIPGKAH